MSTFQRGGLRGWGPHIDGVLPRMRGHIGESTLFWSNGAGHQVSSGWWTALSGAANLSFNVVLCHGADPDLVTKSLETVAILNQPSTIILAGPALGCAQTLCDANWVCLGSTPMMALFDLVSAEFHIDASVSQISRDQVEDVRGVIRRTFHMDANAAVLAIPDTLFDLPGHGVWSLTVDGEVHSCMVSVVVDGSMVCWSMATLPSSQGHGYGRRLLASVLASHAADGVTTALLYSSPQGESLYRSLGYQTMEHWQLWSRPRWALGRG
jgi:GNAT superfamily N-acetyltransferase